MAGTFTSKHPQYDDQSPDWEKVRDAYKGERQVKSKGSQYLPPTNSHILDGFGNGQVDSIGNKSYAAFKKRARFHNFFREAVQMAIGMMHSQPAEITVPKAMEDIRTKRGEDLQQLLRRINTEQLITGRIGIMADMPSKKQTGAKIPYLSTYNAEAIINWEDGESDETVPQTLNMVVLDESEHVRTSTFDWELKSKYRVLSVGTIENNELVGPYSQGVFRDNDSFSESAMKQPNIMGRTLKKMPFVIVNSADLVSDTDQPPLLDLVELCMTIYRGDADFRHNLYMQGQDTFVTSGANLEEDDKLRLGANARIDLPMGATAEYVGVSGSGLSEQAKEQDKLQSRAGSMGAQTLDTTSRERESGDSLRIRVAARTADMNQIVEAGASGLEKILKIAAEWMGENPDEVSVKPNKEFGEMPITGQTMVEMSAARNQGFPVSLFTLHAIARSRRLTKLSFEEEIAQIRKEQEDPVTKISDNGDVNPDQNSEGDGSDGEPEGEGNGPGSQTKE